VILRHLRIALLGAALLVLAACASNRLVTAASGIGLFDMQVDTSLDWARIKLPRQELWTIDGLPLNRFVFFSAVKPNEHVFLQRRATRGRPDGPWYRSGMRPDELRDVILDGFRESQWTRVESSGLRPQDFGGREGVRFELSMTDTGGLNYRGTAAAVVRPDGKLNLMFWLAPTEHYFGRDQAAVERMFASLRFAPER
jgi:hypothetical protein